jgi:hypothetical protein
LIFVFQDVIDSYLVARATNDGGEDSPGSIISGESGLAHAGAVVNDKSSCVLVTHLEKSRKLVEKK